MDVYELSPSQNFDSTFISPQWRFGSQMMSFLGLPDVAKMAVSQSPLVDGLEAAAQLRLAG